jgi:hypothetical protein
MRRLFVGLTLMALLAFGANFLTGCGGGGGDEMLDYDPKVSEEKRVEYEKQMREGMQKQGRPVPNQGGTK